MKLTARIKSFYTGHAGDYGGFVYAVGGGHQILIGITYGGDDRRQKLRLAAKIGHELREIIEYVREDVIEDFIESTRR